MEEYPEIQSIFKRGDRGKFLDGQYSLQEFEYLSDNLWECTEKVDGTNIRIGWDGESVKIGGRTQNAQIPTFLYDILIDMFIPDVFAQFDSKLILYGEGFGAKIQKGEKYIPDSQSFVLFDVLIDEWWLLRPDIEDIATKIGIGIVPIIGHYTLSEAIESVKTGTIISRWGAFEVEGVVLKTPNGLKFRNGARIITKLKGKDFAKEVRK